MAPDTPPPGNGEFDLIRRHFLRSDKALSAQVALGIGDDCALLQPAPGHQLAISTDMLVQGRHFFPDVDPVALGHKALAVNLSDLAAMGARPLGFTLALALPQVDHGWLAAFSRGLFALADAHECPLIGGDTTRGPLNLCITVLGELRTGQALRRRSARAGDDLYLSGQVGEARLALEHRRGRPWTAPLPAAALPALQRRLDWPEPRLALGRALAGIAHAALDISDGLAGDLGHMLQASRVGATLELARLPVPPALADLPPEWRRECLLHGGDDYELLFTAPADARAAVAAAATQAGTPVQRIGHIDAAPGLRGVEADGRVTDIPLRGHDHFDGTDRPGIIAA